MGNQDRSPLGVERLEPRLTLSSLRLFRQRAKPELEHAVHTDPAPSTDTPVIAAQSIEPETEVEQDSAIPPMHVAGRLRANGGFGTDPGDPDTAHSASGLHTESSGQTGLIAFASDHDPGHFALVPASLVNMLP